MLVDGSGQLLYVQQGGQAAVYMIDRTTGVLSAPSTSSAPVPFSLGHGTTVAHPVEPYLYTLQSGGQIHVFEITDFTSGALHELADSPYTVAGAEGVGGLALTHNAASQTAASIAAQLVPSAINFDDTAVGLPVSNNSALLTNTGTDALGVTVTITGADQSDFSTTACPSPLAARTSCPITVTFTPMQTGARQATLVVADSAGPQTLQLTGIGVASSSSGSGSGSGSSGGSGSGSGSGSGGSGSGGSGSGGTGGTGGSGGSGNPPSSSQPTISVSSLSLSFTSPALNTAAPPQNITLTNNSSVSLQISSLQIIGPNASDFALGSNTCTNQSYASNLGCTPSVIFTPSSSGSRFATLVVTDNAVNSPQPVTFSVSITTLAASPTLTFLDELTRYCRRTGPNQITPSPVLQIFFTAACALMLFRRRRVPRRARPSNSPHDSPRLAPCPLAISASAVITVVALLALSLFTVAGCGGASTVATATTVTPTSASQTYTIIITPTAMTSDNSSVPNVQPIQLTLVVN
jgi:hypothetical protein